MRWRLRRRWISAQFQSRLILHALVQECTVFPCDSFVIFRRIRIYTVSELYQCRSKKWVPTLGHETNMISLFLTGRGLKPLLSRSCSASRTLLLVVTSEFHSSGRVCFQALMAGSLAMPFRRSYVRRLQGELNPVQIKPCDDSTGQKWDIITAGKHNNSPGFALIVSSLVRFYFDCWTSPHPFPW